MSEIITGSILFTTIVVVLASIVLGARWGLRPQGTVTVTVNDDVRLLASAGQKLLGVLSDGGILVPSACSGSGTCGLCRVRVTHGGTELSPTERSCITRTEAGAGWRLACQVSVRNDLSLQVPQELFGVESWECVVRSARTVAPFIREIVFDLPPGAEMRFRAGAFVQIVAPPYATAFESFDVSPQHESIWGQCGLRDLAMDSTEATTRAYSLANRPQDKGVIVIDVRLALPPPGSGAPPGVVSSYLFSLKVGDSVRASGPFGTFHVQPTAREMVLIGGGAGMAPLRAIIHEQLGSVGTARKMSYWYGARSRVELFYTDEMDALRREHENFSWTVALSEPKPDDAWEGATGFIHEVVYSQYLGSHAAPEECEYYLCGPPLMAKAVLAMLDELGVGRDAIYFDDFGT